MLTASFAPSIVTVTVCVELVVPSLWAAANALSERIEPRPPRERAPSTRLPRSPGAIWER